MFGQKVHPGFTLSGLIANVRRELIDAKRPKNEAILLLEKCELELAVMLEGESGVEVKWIPVTAKLAASAQHVSKVKLSFKPAPDAEVAYAAFEAQKSADYDDDEMPTAGAEIGDTGGEEDGN